jgi:hypothetical protein
MQFRQVLFYAALARSRRLTNRSIFWRRVALWLHTGWPWAEVRRHDEQQDSLLDPPFHVAPDVPRKGALR